MKLVFATTNFEKLNEAKLALAPYGFEVEALDFEFNEPLEGDMEYIAKSKLLQIKDIIVGNVPIFVDDSGIYFEAYNNFPGILTRRIFNLIGYKGVRKLLAEENRNAYFHGVIAFMWNDKISFFHGETHGSIIEEIPFDLPADLKFPFDPIFVPVGMTKTLGDMSIEERLKHSYRKKALDDMGLWLNSVQKITVT